MTKIDMSARDKRSIWFLALGLLLLGAGMATVSSLLAFAGLFAIATTVRYRKKASLWEYPAFLALAILIVMLDPPSSPLMGAIPLMLSCVLDYIDEQRQKRAALSKAALAAGTRPAEPGDAPNSGPATPSGNLRAEERLPSNS